MIDAAERLTSLFPPELRTASIVPRWSVVWTLTRDTVANHSYYVAMYSRSIARVIGWSGSYAALLFMALTHDLDETITGDIVSPVKSEIIDRDRYDDYVERKMYERLPGVMAELDRIDKPTNPDIDDVYAIIRCADRLDALLYLIGERRMGNGVIAARTPDALRRLEASWYELPAPRRDVALDQLWATVMLPAIRAHETDGGDGV